MGGTAGAAVILPDINVLVYAFRKESAQHGTYADWLARLVAGQDELGLNGQVLGGFLRIVTNRRIYAEPAPAAIAVAFVDALRAARRARWLPAGDATWERLGALVRADRQVAGNLVPDARSPRRQWPTAAGWPRQTGVSPDFRVCASSTPPAERGPADLWPDRYR